MVGARFPDQRGPVVLTDAGALVGDAAALVDEPDEAQLATMGAYTARTT